MLSLPELNISYWSLKDKAVAKANLAGKVITVEGDAKAGADNKVAPVAQPTQQQIIQAEQVPATQQQKDIASQLEDIANSPQAPNFILMALAFVICFIMFVSFKILTQAKRNKIDLDEELVNMKPEKKVKNTIAGRRVIDSKKPSGKSHKIINFTTKEGRVANYDTSFVPLIEGIKNFSSNKEYEKL